MVSPKNIALTVLGTAVLGLGAVVAVDHTVGATPQTQAASLVARTAPTSPGFGLLGKSANPARIIRAIATELGVTPETLRVDVKNGETLDQIAGSKDAQVKADALAAVTKALDKLVAKGVIAQGQEASLLHDAQDAINQVFSAKLGKLFPRG